MANYTYPTTYATTYAPSCVTETVPYTTSVPYPTTYTSYVPVVTTVPGYVTTSAYTSCPYTDSCYTTYYPTTVPPYPTTTTIYSTYVSTTYAPTVTYSYATSCPPTTCPYVSTVTVYSTVCPTYTPQTYPTTAYPVTTYHPKRSLSNDQASVTPVVVGVARALGIVALLGLLIYYFLFKRAASKASRRLRLGESDRKENFSDSYGPTEAGPVRQYVQDEPTISTGGPTSSHRAGVGSRV
jgi:hypothetical protein